MNNKGASMSPLLLANRMKPIHPSTSALLFVLAALSMGHTTSALAERPPNMRIDAPDKPSGLHPSPRGGFSNQWGIYTSVLGPPCETLAGGVKKCTIPHFKMVATWWETVVGLGRADNKPDPNPDNNPDTNHFLMLSQK